MKKTVKISKNQWINAGVKKGIINRDNSLNLRKEAYIPLIIGGVAAAAGILTSVFNKQNVWSKIKDWWQNDDVTPEMLEALQQSRDYFLKNVDPNLRGITPRLDGHLQIIINEISERIQEVTQRLNALGVGPASKENQSKMEKLQADNREKGLQQASQRRPLNLDEHIKRLPTSQSSGSPASGSPASGPQSSGSPASGSPASGSPASTPTSGTSGTNP